MWTKEMMAALEADGEKLRQLTGEEHGPFEICDGCGKPVHRSKIVFNADGSETYRCDPCRRERNRKR